MAVRLYMSLHPIANVANTKIFRILVFVDLLEIQAIFKGHIAGILFLFPEGLTADP